MDPALSEARALGGAAAIDREPVAFVMLVLILPFVLFRALLLRSQQESGAHLARELERILRARALSGPGEG